MMRYPVNTQTVMVCALSPWFHNAVIPPNPAPTPVPGLDIPCPQHYLATIPTGFTKKVMHQFQFICLDGHNIGALIPHVTYPPSGWISILMMLSERKLMFSASTVKLEGTPAGVAAIAPMMPMMDCGDPTGNPLTVYPMNSANTMHVGMTPMDVIFGVVGIAIDVVVDAVFEQIPSPPGAQSTVLTAVADAFAPVSSKALRKWATKTILSNVQSNVRTAIDPAQSTYGVSVKYGKEGFVQVSSESSYNTETDVVSRKVGIRGSGGGATSGTAAEAEVNYGGSDAAPEDQGFGARAQADTTVGGEPAVADTREPAPSTNSQSSSGNSPPVDSNPSPENLTPGAGR